MLTNDLSRVARWVARMVEGDALGAQSAVGWLRDDVLTCGVFYENFTGRSITATIAISPGAVVPKDFLWAIFNYPFNQLKVFKIFAMVGETNLRSQRLVEKMGFVRETVICDYYPDGDMFVYAMTKQQCRFLEKDDGKENQNT